MKKYCLLLLLLIGIGLYCWGQARAVERVAEHFSERTAKEAALDIAKRQTYKELLREGIERTGRKFTGEALGRQVAKRAIREELLKKIEKEGVESFLEYGSKKALMTLERTGSSVIKEHMLADEVENASKKSAYHLAIEQAGLKNEKNVAERSGENIAKKFAREENEAIVAKYAEKAGLNKSLQNKLLREMSANDRLAELIHNDPEFNIKRWKNTRNHVDKLKLTRDARGKAPTNANNYAGNTFYFEPGLNNNVAAALRTKGKYNDCTLEDLVKLDKEFPNGVPFTKEGFPDFIAAGACKMKPNGEPIIVTFKDGFLGTREKDFAYADKEARKMLGVSGNVNIRYGYTWHHLPGKPDRMVLVRDDVHSIVKHSGGFALNK